jgi:glutaminase
LRRVDALIGGDAEYLILDFRRVHEVDEAARRLLLELIAWVADRGRKLIFAHVATDGPLAPLYSVLKARFPDLSELVFAHRDEALEWCENRQLANASKGRDTTKFSLAELEIFRGLSKDELKLLESAVSPLIFEAGETIVREGDPARLFFVVARGTATVRLSIRTEEGVRQIRVASLGPGLSFGEMALLDGGTRSANVVADERVVCYGFSVEHLRELGREHPKLFTIILANMMRDFSERLRRANDEIRALEQ